MDGISIGLFLLATYLGGMVSGIAGFAMGLVVSGVWLHILTPLQTAILMVGYGLISQGMGIWRLRRALDWRAIAPFVIGGAFGVPLGAVLLSRIDPAHVRGGVGAFLMLYSVYNLARPKIAPVQVGKPADLGIGFLNGVLGGLTGLGGVVVTVWCQLHGWPKDRQRAIFQPVLFATIVLSAVSLSAVGAVTAETFQLYLLGVPFMLAGTQVGLWLYGKLDEAGFRRVVLWLLMASGVSLLVPFSLLRGIM